MQQFFLFYRKLFFFVTSFENLNFQIFIYFKLEAVRQIRLVEAKAKKFVANVLHEQAEFERSTTIGKGVENVMELESVNSKESE